MENKTIDNRLIFVGGSPRSGTTLVQNILDSHPDILGGPEFLYLPHLVELRGKFHFSISQGWIDIFCSKEQVDNHIIAIIEHLFLALANKNDRYFYSEKTPMNILVFPELLELFPDAHFIQVIRDPRAIISSMQQVRNRAVKKGLKPPEFTDSLNKSIEYVTKCFESGFAAVKKAPDKVLTVVYEKLLDNPEDETKRMCRFLDIEWHDSMLYPGKKEHMGEHAITKNSDEIWYDATSYNKNPDSTHVDQWKTKLTLSQKIRILLAFRNHKELIGCGYDFSIKSLSPHHAVMATICFYYLLSLKKSLTLLSRIARKIPGVRYVKNGLSALADFLD